MRTSASARIDPPLLVLPGITDSFGAAAFRVGVPLDQALRGVAVLAQAAVSDPTVSGIGVALTSGQRLVIGD